MRGQARLHRPGAEGQGEVIELSVEPVSLAALDSSDELLQSGFWAFFKQAHGWRARPFTVRAGAATPSFQLLVLTRTFLRTFVLAYVPFGPVFDPACGRGELLSALSRAVRPHLPKGTMLVRFDLPWEKSGEEPRWSGAGPKVLKSPSDMQPPATVIVDLAPPLEGILSAMKSKTRYNIRLAEKKGVTVREAAPEDFDAWYALYQETSRRDRIAIHSAAYYRGLLAAAREYPGEKPQVRLLLARHEGEILAGNICIFGRSRAVYLTGASGGRKRNLMPTYALQWEAIRMAKHAGCTEYDLYGIPPKPDEGHAMHGLYQFKTGFSEKIVERWGTWDAPCLPARFALYRAAEGARMFYYRSVKKRLRRSSRSPEGS
ncbi:MAG TPA: peptidoglycan bridge formation glycyltransferase FemA/FemB family protein [Spirochaetia bacterium]|nr:peptidoglycan bridge formation glycyltransferase FemA/FemB family protein [Spirochaetia bacterium]